MSTKSSLTIDSINIHNNVRKDSSADETLIESVRTHGILEPLLVREENGSFILVSGHRRLSAAIEAGLKEVPVRVIDATADTAAEIQLSENTARRDLSVTELTKYICDSFNGDGKSLLDDQPTPEAWAKIKLLAYRIGVLPKFVLAIYRIQNKSKALVKHISKGKLTPDLVLQLARLPKEVLDKLAESGPVGGCLDNEIVHESSLQRWLAQNCERNLTKAPFDTKAKFESLPMCLSCFHNTAADCLFDGKDSLGSCVKADCWNRKKAITIRDAERVLKAKAEGLPVLGNVSPGWDNKLTYQNRVVHTELKGELKKLAEDSRDKKAGEAAVGAVIIRKDGKPDSIGFVILKDDSVKSKKLKNPAQKPERDWKKEQFIDQFIIKAISAKIDDLPQPPDAKLLETLNEINETDTDDKTLADAIYTLMTRELQVGDLCSIHGLDYDKLKVELTPEAEAAYAATLKAAETPAKKGKAKQEDHDDDE